MSHGPGFANFGSSWVHSFSEKSYWWNLSWKTRANSANSSAFWVLPPANEAMHVPSPDICKPLEKSWAHSFSGQSHWWNLSWKPVPTALLLSTSLPPNGALPKLFPTVSLPYLPFILSSFPCRSFPPELSPSYSPRFPFRPPSRHSRIAPSHRSSPQAISPVSPPCTLSSFPYRSFPTLLPHGALPKLFPTVPPPSTPSSLPYIAPSQGSSPKAISHGFPSVHPVITSVYRSFPPELRFRIAPSQRSSPQAIFPTVPPRPPSCRFRIAPSPRSSPKAISHGFPSVHPVVIPVSLLPTAELSPSYFLRFPFRPPFRHSRIAPSHRSSPQAISHGFPSVHPVVAPVSLLPTGALHKLFPTASLPSTLSSLPYRSFPPELSPSYSPRFPFRPPSRHSRIAPSRRSSPLAISHGFLSVHPIVASIRSLPTEISPSFFPRFPLRPPSRQIRIAPSRQMWLNENPSIGDAFGRKKNYQLQIVTVHNMGKYYETLAHPCTPSKLPPKVPQNSFAKCSGPSLQEWVGSWNSGSF